MRTKLPHPVTGLWHTLTPDQQQRALAYDGPVGFGDTLAPMVNILAEVDLDRVMRFERENGCSFGAPHLPKLTPEPRAKRRRQ